MLTAALLVGAVVLGQADAGADDDLKRTVRRLIYQLDSDRLSQRQSAEEALLKLGPAALDLLPQPTDRHSAEVLQRVARVRQKLQHLVARAAGEPSLITLRGDAMPLSKVLAALAEQSGNKIVDFRGEFGQQVTDPPLKFDFDKTPFWEALDQVLDRAELRLYGFGEEKAINFVAGAGPRRPRVGSACYAGPLRIEPIRMLARREFQQAEGDSLQLTLSVDWEPRLNPLNLSQKTSEIRAVDGQDRPLAVEDVGPVLNVPTGGATSVQLKLPFQLPPRDVKRIASLKGKLTAMIPGKVETFTFDRLTEAKNVEKRVAGVTVTLNRVQRNNELWQVRMQVQFDKPGGALASHLGWIYDNEAYLEDPDGKPVPYDSQEFGRQADNQVGVAYLFVLEGPLDGYKFVYKTPGVIMSTEFDYEIKGIELP